MQNIGEEGGRMQDIGEEGEQDTRYSYSFTKISLKIL